MNLPWNIQQTRENTKMMDKFDFKAFGINLKNNTESLTIVVNNSGDQGNFLKGIVIWLVVARSVTVIQTAESRL